jgi:hypothetical protein
MLQHEISLLKIIRNSNNCSGASCNPQAVPFEGSEKARCVAALKLGACLQNLGQGVQRLSDIVRIAVKATTAGWSAFTGM